MGYQPHFIASEEQRLAILARLGLLDTPPEREFDTIVTVAHRLLGCKIALVSLVDRERQWFKAKYGLAVDQTPRELAFCAHAVAADDSLVVPDATMDPRFATNPLVTGAPGIRFYAGVPIRAGARGQERPLPMGTLCVIDDSPRAFSADDLALLGELAQLVEGLMHTRSQEAEALRLAEERGSALRRLDQTNRKLRQAERMANVGSWRLTLADNRTEWSEQTYAIHGLPPGETPPLERALDFYPPSHRAMLQAALGRAVESGAPFDIESDFITAQGASRRVRSMGEVEMADGQPVALVGVFQDITERYGMEQTLRLAANTDALTGLANRGHFNTHLDEAVARALEADTPLAVLLIDLDHFKAVNDRCGHPAGDELLRLMAARMQAPALRGSFAARLGGDEFVMILTDPQLLADLAAVIAGLLRDLRHTVSTAVESVRVSATIGACHLGATGTNRHDLLQQADAALYEAKRLKRGAARIAGEQELILAQDAVLPKGRGSTP